MLELLRVRNLAIAEDVSVEFGAGLNTITGETGAGKSILLNALGLVLGGRADRSTIRSGSDQCSVEAIFQLVHTADVDAILDEAGLEPLEDGQLIVRRVVKAGGAGRNFLNGSPTTVNVLKAVGTLLVDMHGPHDHQSLLSQDFQLRVLDAFAGLETTRSAYAEAYGALMTLQRERSALDEDEASVAERIDMLGFQVKEIEDAAISADDASSVDEEHAQVANAQRIQELAGAACQAMTDGDVTAFDLLVETQRALEGLDGLLPDTEAWLEEARAVSIQVQELSKSVSAAVLDVDASPERMQWLEERKSLYAQLKRKYGSTVEEILAFHVDAAERLSALRTRDERLRVIDEEITTQRGQVMKQGAGLRKERQKAADRLSDAITTALQDLGFGEGAFDVAMRETEPTTTGIDEIEFGFAPNPGEKMRALRSIASSGEISRVMLATKAVLAGHDRIPVLVFDEIDANLGGEMGHAVGSKLAAVAEAHQVICITHLPQVAAHGQRHLAVRKEVHEGRTFTSITELGKASRTSEIARMLGGGDESAVSLDHATELLEQAQLFE